MIQILLGVLRIGRFVSYTPYSVTSGFMSGIGIIIILIQTLPFLGWPVPTGGPLEAIRSWPEALGDINFGALGIAAVTLVVAVAWPVRFRKYFPPTLAALAVGTTIGVLLLTNTPVIGEIPMGLPSLRMPDLAPGALAGAVEPAILIALLGSIDSLLTSLITDSMTRRGAEVGRIAQRARPRGRRPFRREPGRGPSDRAAAPGPVAAAQRRPTGRGRQLLPGPGIDDRNPAVSEIVHVPGRHRRSPGSSDSGNLAVCVTDWAPGGTPLNADSRVGPSGIAVEGEDAAREVLPKHALDRSEQLFTAAPRRQECDTVAEFGFANAGEMQLRERLPGNPVDDINSRRRAHQLGDDVGIEEDQGEAQSS